MKTHNVRGNLKWRHSEIPLPETLEVDGDLDFSGCWEGYLLDDSHFPKRQLKMSGSLNLRKTFVIALPERLEVGGDLDLSLNGYLHELPEVLKVGGSLNLSRTGVIGLPERLEVGGDLDLSHTLIERLPKGLKVGGNLDLRHTLIERLPKGLGLKVGGHIFPHGRKSSTDFQ